MSKKKETVQEEFVKEMTGKSLRQVELDKYMKGVIDDIIKNKSDDNLVGIVAIGDFHDIDNPVISSGGLLPSNPRNRDLFRGLFLMKCVEGFIRDCDDNEVDVLKWFIHDCKAMLDYYEKFIKDFEQEQAAKEKK